jgi:hypothetical protein
MTVPAPHGDHELDAVLHLLDRQIVDPEGQLVAKVDDVELRRREDGGYEVSAVLVGPAVLGPRLGGVVGRIFTAVHARLADDPRPGRIDPDLITDIGSAVTVRSSAASVYQAGFETWARTRLIDKLPGANDDPDS